MENKIDNLITTADKLVEIGEKLLKDYCELHDNPTKYELFTNPMYDAIDKYMAAKKDYLSNKDLI